MVGCSTNNTTSDSSTVTKTETSTEITTVESISETIDTESIPENTSTESSETALNNFNASESTFEITTFSEETASTEIEAAKTDHATEKESSSSTDNDVYVGNYFDTKENESTMIISKNSDGSYYIEITRFRLTYMECTGNLTDAGLIFIEDNSPTDMEGIITINENLATVTFTNSTWNYIKPNDSFLYEKQN